MGDETLTTEEWQALLTELPHSTSPHSLVRSLLSDGTVASFDALVALVDGAPDTSASHSPATCEPTGPIHGVRLTLRGWGQKPTRRATRVTRRGNARCKLWTVPFTCERGLTGPQDTVLESDPCTCVDGRLRRCVKSELQRDSSRCTVPLSHPVGSCNESAHAHNG